MDKDKIIEFRDIRKTFVEIRRLGSGGTGETRLLKDTTTNTEFAFKKYVPADNSMRKEYYDRFVEEIKILFNITHPNIVRVYNYYLYPERMLGYIQMEFIDGVQIDNYNFIDDEINEIFVQAIGAFEYLESMGILHRDVRPENLLVTKEGRLKVIDFGFGKNTELHDHKNSILLNWPVSEKPEEVSNKGDYTESTEVFFVGKLFQHIINDNKALNARFKYKDILLKMVEIKNSKRYSNFSLVKKDISRMKFDDWSFSEESKKIYRLFADALFESVCEFNGSYDRVTDSAEVVSSLDDVIRENSLEENIQNNAHLIACFLKNNFRYYKNHHISLGIVEEFRNWFAQLDDQQRAVVLDNLSCRFSNVKISIDVDDMPF